MSAILLLGIARSDACDDREMNRRCQLAATQYHRTKGTRVIACGGAQRDETETEALTMKKQLIEFGVAPDDILLEELSQTTMENLRNAWLLLTKEDRGDLLIVTSDYHRARVRLIARRLGITAQVYGAKTPFSTAKVRRVFLEILCMADVIMGFEDPGARKPAWRRTIMNLLKQEKP